MITMSPQIEKLATALSAAQKEMTSAAFNKANPHFKSKYADLDECWNSVRKPLTSYGLSVTQWPAVDGRGVTITTMLLHISGQYLMGALKLEAKDATPQAIGSAITYGRRYGLSAAVGITADEDDDGNTAQPPKPEKPNRVSYYKPEPSYVKDIEQPVQAPQPKFNKDEHWPHVLKLLGLTGEEPVATLLADRLAHKTIDRAIIREEYEKALQASAVEG